MRREWRRSMMMMMSKKKVVGSGIGIASSRLPWLMLPPSFRGSGEMEYNLYSPSKEEVVRLKGKGGKEEADIMRDEATRLVGSSHGWLALLNERTGDMLLSNPVSGRRMKLPPFRRPREDCGEDNFKVIISCSADEQGCRALMMPWSPAVSFCCPGRSSDYWCTPRSTDFRFNFNFDFVYSAARRGFFGCMQPDLEHRRRVLEGWNIDGFPRRILHRPEVDMFGEGPIANQTHVYLVAHSDQLYVVSLYSNELHRQKLQFDVFRSSDDEGGLELCSSLEGLVMFVGYNHSMALPSSQFPELKPNSIYLSDHRLQPFTGQSFVGVFDYQDRSWSPCPALQLQNTPASQYPLTWFTPTPTSD